MSERFGPFEIERKLGAGGMAEVFLARRVGREGWQKRVVLKRVLAPLGKDAEFVRAFQDEARLAARLDHPNIASVYDFGEVEGAWFMALEHVDGLDLRALLAGLRRAGQQMPVDATLQVAVDVATALLYAHELTLDGAPARIVHRDVTPSNVLVSIDGAIKLADFGIARASTHGHRTRTGVIKGKVPYMPPEQALGRAMDHRVDLFALGVVLFECVGGRRPYDGVTELDTLHNIIAGRRPSLAELAPHAPAPLCALVARLLSPEPGERHASAGALLDALAATPPSIGARRLLGQLVRRVRGQEQQLALAGEADVTRAPRMGTEVLDMGAAPSAPEPVRAPPDAATRTRAPYPSRAVSGPELPSVIVAMDDEPRTEISESPILDAVPRPPISVESLAAALSAGDASAGPQSASGDSTPRDAPSPVEPVGPREAPRPLAPMVPHPLAPVVVRDAPPLAPVVVRDAPPPLASPVLGDASPPRRPLVVHDPPPLEPPALVPARHDTPHPLSPRPVHDTPHPLSPRPVHDTPHPLSPRPVRDTPRPLSPRPVHGTPQPLAPLSVRDAPLAPAYPPPFDARGDEDTREPEVLEEPTPSLPPPPPRSASALILLASLVLLAVASAAVGAWLVLAPAPSPSVGAHPVAVSAPPPTAPPPTAPPPTAPPMLAEAPTTVARQGPPVAPSTQRSLRASPNRTPERAPPEPPPEPERAERARVRVVVVPYGEVAIDGRALGRAPVVTRVAPGRHRVVVTSAARTVEREVVVGPGDSRTVTIELPL